MPSDEIQERPGFTDLLAELTDSDLVIEVAASPAARKTPQLAPVAGGRSPTLEPEPGPGPPRGPRRPDSARVPDIRRGCRAATRRRRSARAPGNARAASAPSISKRLGPVKVFVSPMS